VLQQGHPCAAGRGKIVIDVIRHAAKAVQEAEMVAV
jgi:hypothetical protein